MILRAACLTVLTALPAAAQDMVETCKIKQSCPFDAACGAGTAAFDINMYFGDGDDATYTVSWNGKPATDVRHHDGQVFTWLTGENGADDQRSFALSYIYNSQMPDPEVAEFLLTESVIQGRLTNTIIHSGQCRESE